MKSYDAMLTAALEAYARGWAVVPVVGKRAIGPWMRWQTERPSPQQLREWFGPDANPQPTGLAVILGPVSGGLCCRDFDEADGYDRWASLHVDLAGTLPTVRTAKGWHVYFRAEGYRVKYQSDGELRGEGGYVLLPPSSHPTGEPYRWVVLPSGTVPTIDPLAVGLCQARNREQPRAAESSREHLRAGESGGEQPRKTETTEKTDEVRGGIHASNPIENSSLPLALESDSALLATIPTKLGKRHRAVFRLTRVLKARAEYADLPGNAPGLRAIVKAWHTRALAFIGTKAFEATWGDFLRAWPRVKQPAGTATIDVALARAESTPPPAWSTDYSAPAQLLAALCRELAALSAPGPIFLSCDTAAQLVGVDKGTAWRMLEVFQSEGRLVVVEQGRNRRATRYRYVGDDQQPGTAHRGSEPASLPPPFSPTVGETASLPAPLATPTRPTGSPSQPVPVTSVADVRSCLQGHGMTGPNLEALAQAPGMTLTIIEEEVKRTRARKKVRDYHSYLFKLLAARVGLKVENGRAMNDGAAGIAMAIEAKKRQLGKGGAASPVGDGLTDVVERVINNEEE